MSGESRLNFFVPMVQLFYSILFHEQRVADHLIEQPGAYVGVPLRFPRRDLAQVHAHDALFGPLQGAQQAGGLIPGETAWHRGAGAGTERRVQTVDVPREIHVARQVAHDTIGDLRERVTLLLACGDVPVVETDDAAPRRVNHRLLAATDVAQAGLHQLGDA